MILLTAPVEALNVAKCRRLEEGRTKLILSSVSSIREENIRAMSSLLM